MNYKDPQDLQHLQDSQEIFNLGLSWVEFSQLQDLMEHTKHIELEADHYEKLNFLLMKIKFLKVILRIHIGMVSQNLILI